MFEKTSTFIFKYITGLNVCYESDANIKYQDMLMSTIPAAAFCVIGTIIFCYLLGCFKNCWCRRTPHDKSIVLQEDTESQTSDQEVERKLVATYTTRAIEKTF